jgi:hypothetical protein
MDRPLEIIPARYSAVRNDLAEELRAKVKDALIRSRLSSFIRYCSAKAVTPAEVDEITVDKFIDYRARCSKPVDPAFRRLLARAWNANVGNIPGWPKRRLVEPQSNPRWSWMGGVPEATSKGGR